MLKIWFPGTNDTEDYGLGGTQWINDNVVITDNGKLGKCLSFNGSNSRLSTTNFELSNNWSFACWAKDDLSVTNWRLLIMLNTTGSDADTQMSLWLLTGEKRFEVCANGKYVSTVKYVPGQWNHFAATYDGSQILVYLNGVKVYTLANTNEQLARHNLTIGARGTNANGGHEGATSYFYGLVNDLRIWDNQVISPREIKELSKGLVLHYPLAMPGGENLLKNSLTNFPELWSGSGDGRTLTTQSGVSVPEWGCTDGLRVYGKSGASSALCLLINDSTHGLTVPSASVSGQKYTPSIYIKNNHQNAIYIAFNSMSTGQSINQGEIKKVILNATGNGKQYLQFTIFASGANKEYDFTFWHPKIELGEVCTPWVPATTDSLYSTMGFNDGVEYDVSGYQHNGTKTGTFTYDVSTPRYNTSTVFSGSNHIAVGRLLITDELTYNWWAYSDNWGSLGGSMMSSIEGGGMGHQNGSSTYLWFACGTGTSSNDYGSGYRMPTPSAGWHMFTETWDGYRFKVYLDGELKFTNERYTTKTPVYYSQGYNFLFIGGESGGSATTPGDHFIGKLSDARVYATALSTDDVMALYHTPISLSNNGTLLTQGEFVES